MFRSSRLALAMLSALAGVAGAGTAMAQSWPTRPISMVVPFGAGSASDTVGRILGAGLSEALGQQVIVENISGAGGMTGTARAVNAAPDGYQFVIGSVDTLAINQTLYKKPLYNAANDLAPVGLVVEQPIVLIARADFPVRDLKEFVAHVKANQGKVQFGSSGVGSGSHLACARLNAAIGAEPTHVPYRGSGQAMQDLAGGRIDYFCALGAAAVAPLESKTAKAIAVLAQTRSPLFPDVASSQEQGVDGVQSYFWSGFFVPKATPAPVIGKLHEATEHTLESAATQERLRRAGVTAVGADRRSTEYLRSFVSSEIANWAATIKASGVSID